MKYDFVADADKLNELYKTLNEQISNVTTALKNIFDAYENLANYWTGDNYKNFIDNARLKKPEIEKCIDVFNGFADQINDAATGATSLNSSIATKVGISARN